MSFDPSKPVRTRDGQPARIICTDARVDYPIVALVTDGDRETLETFREDGKYTPSGRGHDLINIPERHVRWLNIYGDADSDGDWCPHPSKVGADAGANTGRIACIRIEFEEGEGL